MVSPCSIMVHHGFGSKEVRHPRKRKTNYTKHHLLVTCQGYASRKHNQTFPLVDLFNFKPCCCWGMFIYIYIYNKTEDLCASVKCANQFCPASIKCFNETWLNDNIIISHVNINGLSIFCADRANKIKK